jgi:lipopolysaccharide transport system ATP-binding protein
MFVRSAFEVSTVANPEVLLLNEVMGAGDLSFTLEANKRMREFIGLGKIHVLSSRSLKLLCDYLFPTIWLDGGTKPSDGSINDVVALHEDPVLQPASDFENR